MRPNAVPANEFGGLAGGFGASWTMNNSVKLTTDSRSRMRERGRSEETLWETSSILIGIDGNLFRSIGMTVCYSPRDD